MPTSEILYLAERGLILAAVLSGIPLAVSLIIGLIVSIFQAATQIQEATLTFVPKLIGAFIALFICGQWMIEQCVTFSRELLIQIGR